MMVIRKKKKGYCGEKDRLEFEAASDRVVREEASLRILRLTGHLNDEKEPAMKRFEGRESFPGGGKSLVCYQIEVKA